MALDFLLNFEKWFSALKPIMSDGNNLLIAISVLFSVLNPGYKFKENLI